MADSDLREDKNIERVHEAIKFEALKAIVETISSSSTKLIIYEFEKALEKEQVASHISHNLMPYLYTAGLLSFAGREINERNMTDVLRAIDISPDPLLLKVIFDTGIKSHLAYIYAFYFLIANGREPSEKNILSLIWALGLPPDPERVSDIIKFISPSSQK
jgi:ribosomal protein L12E/L44/L45/RPP1/RPP2